MIAVYCRQSVEKKDSISIEQQEAACRSLCFEKDYEVFADKGFTGANTNRPAFEKMMKAVEKGKITKVIVYKVDRISRSLLDFVGIYQRFEMHKVEFVSCSEQFDTSSAMGKATLQIIMVFAELERSMIQKRVKDNFYERAKKGLFLAGVAPYGYRKKKVCIEGVHTSMLEPDDEHQEKIEIVRWIYEEFCIKQSIGEIVRQLNERGALTNRGKAFSSTGVSRILRNPVYVRADADVYRYLKSKGANIQQPIEAFTGKNGCTVYGTRKGKTMAKFSCLQGEYVQLNRHEGCIPSGKWLKAQRILDSNRPVSNSGKGENTWLTGLTKCRFCGMGISVVNGGKPGRRYLNCGGKKAHICGGRTKTMTFDDIEEIAGNSLTSYFSRFRFQAEECFEDQKENLMKIQLTNIQEEISSLIQKLAGADHILQEYISQRVVTLDSEQRKLNEQLKQLMKKRECADLSAYYSEKLSQWKELPFDIKKLIARVFIEKVIIGDGDLTIVYR